MRLLRHVAGGSFAAAALVTSAASAAMAPPLSLEAIIDRSPLIVEGAVTRSWVAWDSRHQYIWTHYEIRVIDAIRGSGSTLTVSEPGGSVDGANQAFSGSIGYLRDEHVVLFLFPTPIGYWRTTGGSQGKFTVRRDGRVDPELRNGAEPAGSNSSHLTLSEFKFLVRSLAQSRATDEIR